MSIFPESGDPLNDINALAEVCEPGTVVIAAGQVNDVRLYRDLIVSGIQDYLLKPLNPDMLRDAFTHAQTVLNAPKVSDTGTERPHISTAFIGARGWRWRFEPRHRCRLGAERKGRTDDGPARP